MKTKRTRLETLERQSSSILSGEPVQGEDLWKWLWECAIYYMKAGFISPETGLVVPDAVKGLPEEVQKRIYTVSRPIGKSISLQRLQDALKEQ